VTTYLIMLKPHPRSRARCTSAEPSSRLSGRPTKLSPPLSPLSSRTYEGLLTGALAEPERLTPRSKRVLPWLSTKELLVVWMKWSGVGLPVAGEREGTRGI